ncbi:MAG: tetratricopeptide repeat protein [Acidobacteriota bacterium]
MRLRLLSTICALSLSLVVSATVVSGQAPSSIQLFLPNGDRPPREMRLTLTRDDGRVEIVFTDSKGKFQLTGDLNRDREYDITIEGDGRTFETTTAKLRLLRGGVTYLPIFLRPYKDQPRSPIGVIDLATSEVDVPSQARTAYAEAMKLMGEGHAEPAITALKRALDVYPTYLRALNDLGVLYLKLSRFDEAGEVLRQAIKINKRFHLARLNLGLVLNRQGKFTEAAETLFPLYKEKPSLPGLTTSLAEAWLAGGRVADAKRILRDSIAAGNLEGSHEVEAHYKLALALSREENYGEAIRELQKAIKLDPNAANAHLLLGGGYLQLKRYGEAETELRRAYELGGREMGYAQLLLGQLYVTQQKFEQAQRAFEQYLEEVPGAQNTLQVQEVLVKIKAALQKNPH